MKNIIKLFAATTILFNCIVGSVLAQPEYTEQELRNMGIYFVDMEASTDQCAPTVVTPTSGGGSNPGDINWTGIYQSGTSPPYNVEMFVTHLLKSIALRTNTSESSVVTQEHIVALVTFAMMEGGGTSGHYGSYNLFNTKQRDPDLNAIGRGAEADGTPATYDYPSFDVGVEATTRTMISNAYQSRLVDILLTPSTAEQFFETLTYYDRYPNNLAWAAASDPNNGGNAEEYLALMLSKLSDVRADYERFAGVTLNGSEGLAPVTGGGGTGSTSTIGCPPSAGGGSYASLDQMTYFSQCDSKWRYYPYPYPGDTDNSSGRTICSSGCGPTSLAMVISNLSGTIVTPDVIGDYSLANGFRASSGTSWGAFTAIPEHYGLKSEYVGTDISKVKAGISAGGLVISSMKPGHFTSGGHFIVIRAVTPEGKILVADPNDRQPGTPNYQRKSTTEWDESIIISESKAFWVISK